MTTDLTLLPRVAHRGQEVTAPRLRGLLALLAGDLRTGCSTERLVAGLWPDALPERPGKAVQVLVSRARAQLGADVLASTPAGYRLTLAEEQVDSSALLLHAAASADRARAGDHAGSLAAAEAGLALWEGTPDGGGGTDDPVAALRAERAPVRGALVRARALALARLGRHAEAAGPLAAAAAEHPRDEEVLAELLRGEAATAGPSAALTRYEAYRRELRDGLGTDPGAGLKAVQQELLRGEPPVVRHGVPHEPNPLLGRDEDIAAVERLLRASRAVTVVGPGGLGKTRLAHAVSRRAEQRVVHFVPLAGVTADEDVAAEVASALGAGEGRPGAAGGHAGADPVSGIRGALGSGPALLVLDNCEQVVRGAAGLVRDLVASCEDLRVLATSRAPLGLTSEAVYALPELGLDVSVELFTQRARAARPGVELPHDAVAALCRHLDGLPLAVELAAARVRVLSVPEIARRLGDRFALLRGGARDVPERHRTLHAVVDWSWNLLDEDARTALRTLSVFPGGFSGEAAERVLGDDALLLLERLADQSLVTAADTPAGVRFRMLETVREFSAARRAEAGEDEEAAGRFLAWARGFGLANHDVLFGAEPLAHWESLRAEQDNLVLALRYALARGDDPTTASCTAMLAAIWSTGSSFERLAALAADTGPALSHYRPDAAHTEVARTAAAVCTAALFLGFGPSPVRQLVTLRRLPPAAPDTLVRALARVLCAVPRMRPPAYAALRELCDSPEPMLSGIACAVASYVWEYEHDLERAIEAARRMAGVLGRLGNPLTEILAHGRLSELSLHADQGEEAYERQLAMVDALRRLGDTGDSLGVRWGLALACLQRGAWEEAEEWLRLAEENQPADFGLHSPDLATRAEIAIARGTSEVGLGLWRRAVARLRENAPGQGMDPYTDPWALQIFGTAVTAHAWAGRLEPVGELLAELRERLRATLSRRDAPSPQLSAYGTALYGLAVAGLTTGDASAVRLLALAERLGVLREFQPTMAAGRARRAASDADGAAYADAVSEYAALGRDELREATSAAIADRG
ncbi:AfsR/SARP family transcriptional regulator [Streptomyces sp. AV19]|uniref:ATP-binding protein n=1 Tax=Streptomyces sp. AV19 TaxID=2793068 RepID=UPI0018FE35F4|nr:BTAD domain-containing putative transcriptional regulator [Streptomyces sp. AV19]MBH1936170.1 AfsR/SARP family transcriptional regulator [Streptomyces sp. AV19]MDG4534642.1 AfsR/SARP family transcriptional regulator [Streptomyces sp. AV19]